LTTRVDPDRSTLFLLKSKSRDCYPLSGRSGRPAALSDDRFGSLAVRIALTDALRKVREPSV